jgi:hypothetical protein
MVATDVASRGIGMIETPLPPHSNAQTSIQQCFTLNAQALSRLRILPGFFRVFRFSLIGCLGSVVQSFCATLVIPYSTYFRYKMWNWHFLTLVKLSPRLPNQRTWMCESPTLALNPQWTVHVRCRESIGCIQMQLLH